MYRIGYDINHQMVIEDNGNIIATCVDEFLCKEMMSILGDNTLDNGEFYTYDEIDDIKEEHENTGEDNAKQECQNLYDDFIDKINDAIGDRDTVDADWLYKNISLLDFDNYNLPEIEPIQ